MIPLPLVIPDTPVMTKESFAQVIRHPRTGQHSLHASVFFDAGELICSFAAGTIIHTPNYLTIQLDQQRHITLEPAILQYTNHGCDPNVFFDTDTMQLIALKAIQPGDELCFFYPSTEWRMAQAFQCTCGASHCLGYIEGAAALSADILHKYRLTRFIQTQIAQRDQ